MREQLVEDWTDKSHAECSTSCPDCLRSYDNRRLHGALDWRLALDMLDLAAGLPLDQERWVEPASHMAAGLARTPQLSLSKGTTSAGFSYLSNEQTNRAVLLIHPLWRSDPNHAVEEQVDALDGLEHDRAFERVSAVDVFTAGRRPLAVISCL